MEYKVLYRKYRPDNFNSIIGQDVIIKSLRNAINTNKVAHAYIFSGPRGTGKTSTAKVFAKSLNCQNYNNGPCNKCDACLNFATNPDIVEIDAASNNGVDDVRELINNVRLAPSMSKYKIYIIDEVHMLTPNAFNALLLTLEEPPSNVVFIFATTNIESVPITILSRCQRFDFSQISLEDLRKRISFVSKEEKIDITDDAINEICVISEGGLRDALGILDQLSSQNSKITLDIVQKNFNIVGTSTINDILESFFDNNSEKIIKLIDDIKKNGYDFKNVVKRIIDALYNYLVNNNDRAELIKKLVLELNNLLNEVNIYVNPYTLLKVVLLSYNNNSIKKHHEKNNTIKEIECSENNSKTEDKTEENYFPGNNFDEKLDDLKKIRINNTFVDPTKEDLKKTQKSWDELQEKIKDDNLKMLLVDTKISASSSRYAIITTDLEATAHLINASLSKIEELFEKKFQKSINFICITEEEWKTFKQEYVKNTKKGIKYEIVQESDISYNDNTLMDIADDVFKNIKIEME